MARWGGDKMSYGPSDAGGKGHDPFFAYAGGVWDDPLFSMPPLLSSQ